MAKETSETGLRIRKEMFGADWVDKRMEDATDFTRPFVQMINDFAFGEVWDRPVLDRKARSMLTLAMLVALNRNNELPLHLRGAINNGVTKDEIREILMQAVVYCGFPAVFDSFKVAQATLQELGLEG